MLRIEKQTEENREVTTIGLNLSLNPLNLKPVTAVGAFVGFCLGGLPGVLFGGLVGEVAQSLDQGQAK